VKLLSQRYLLSRLSLGVVIFCGVPLLAQKNFKKPAQTSAAAPAEQAKEPASAARKACAAAEHSS
jgi:hypothetical protein